MSTKYHISPESGRPNICRAHVRACPIGGINEHYDSKDEARKAYEEKMDTATDHLKSVQKEIGDKRDAKKAQELDNLAGLEIINKRTGEVEETLTFTDDEKAMPGYVDHVAKNYEGTTWTTRRKEKSAGQGNGLKMNPYATERGDRFIDKDGAMWEATMVAQPGTYGTAESAGPHVTLGLVKDGEVIVGGYSKTVNFGGLNSPDHFEELDETKVSKLERELKRWENSPGRHQYGFPEDEMIRYNIEEKIKETKAKLEDAKEEEAIASDPAVQAANSLSNEQLVKAAAEAQALNDFYSEPSIARRVSRVRRVPVGEHKHEAAVVAEIQYSKSNPGERPKDAKDTGTKVIIVPGVKRLTDKRRIEIGEELWKASGRDVKRWKSASDEEKIRFSQRHMGRYTDVTVNATPENVDFSLDGGRRSSHGRNNDDVTIMHVGPTS